MQMYERDITTYTLTQMRTCPRTKQKLVKLIEGREKCPQSEVIRREGGSVLLRY